MSNLVSLPFQTPRPQQYDRPLPHPMPSNRIVVVKEINVPRPSSIVGYEMLVSLRTLIFGIARQHALQTHADTLHVLNRRPSLMAQKIQADDAVGVDVRVDRDRSVCGSFKSHFGRFCISVSLPNGGSKMSRCANRWDS
jgi:hypothetical protein